MGFARAPWATASCGLRKLCTLWLGWEWSTFGDPRLHKKRLIRRLCRPKIQPLLSPARPNGQTSALFIPASRSVMTFIQIGFALGGNSYSSGAFFWILRLCAGCSPGFSMTKVQQACYVQVFAKHAAVFGEARDGSKLPINFQIELWFKQTARCFSYTA